MSLRIAVEILAQERAYETLWCAVCERPAAFFVPESPQHPQTHSPDSTASSDTLQNICYSAQIRAPQGQLRMYSSQMESSQVHPAAVSPQLVLTQVFTDQFVSNVSSYASSINYYL